MLARGDPLNDKTLIGPLHTPQAVDMYENAIKGIVQRGGEVLTKNHGRMDVSSSFEEGQGGNFVWPTVVRPKKDDPCWTHE